jgi:ABC-2 type transport system permease protein
MPSWLRGFAANQPVTPVTEAVRALLLGQPAGGHLVPALAWTGGIAAVSMGAAAALFRRGTR